MLIPQIHPLLRTADCPKETIWIRLEFLHTEYHLLMMKEKGYLIARASSTTHIFTVFPLVAPYAIGCRKFIEQGRIL